MPTGNNNALALKSMEPINCQTCWRDGPKLTIYASVLICVTTLITSIYDLTTYYGMGFTSYYYMGLVPYFTLEKVQLWRIISCHFCVPSLWSIVFYGFIFFQASYKIEKLLGSKLYALVVLLSVIAATLLALAVAAFFALTPGINSWSYFASFWFDFSATGPSIICIIVTMIQWKIAGEQDVRFMCFNAKLWVVCLVEIVFCYVAMYPAYHGIWYNISAVIVGLCLPGRVLRRNAIQGTGLVLLNNGGAESTFRKNAKPKKSKEERRGFRGKARTL